MVLQYRGRIEIFNLEISQTIGFKETSDQFIVIFDTEAYGSIVKMQTKVTLNLDNHSEPGTIKFDFGQISVLEGSTTAQVQGGLVGISFGSVSTSDGGLSDGGTDFLNLSGEVFYGYPSIPFVLAGTSAQQFGSSYANKSILFRKSSATSTSKLRGVI